MASRSLFLSPHYDDVALSCGGAVALSAARGDEPVVVTVFGGETLDEVIGDFARWKHGRWGAEDFDDALSRRRREDAAAAAVLGCTTRWLGHLDAVYRGERYRSDSELYGRPLEVEGRLAELIAEEVLDLAGLDARPTCYVPLGIGRHVDHQLTFLAGRQLAARGLPVLAYEDCPYAIHTPDGVGRRLAELAGQAGPEQVLPIGEMLERRIEAVRAYASQLPVIFRFTDDFALALAGHAREVGGGEPAERFWPVPAA